jgi:nucleoside phosphorylase
VARLSPRADVAIVTALGTPELDAVLNLSYQWTNKRFSDDPTGYHFGQIPRADGSLTVVAASARRKSMPSSAALAPKLVERFRPRYIVMLGICAGVRGKTELGDVIVADPSWDWGSGKLAEKPDGSAVFQAAPYQRPLSSHVSQLAIKLSGRPEVVAAIRSGWIHPAPEGKLSVRVVR